jgi:pyridoxamine 5'-phosphate oxidase
MNLEDARREYLSSGLNREQLETEPLLQFKKWMQQAVEFQLTDATAMTLATVSISGQPSQRTVLLKQIDADGFIFFTNLNSKKAQDISENAKVSLHFSWLQLERQVKIQGVAEKLSSAKSLQYFLTRPRDSQLAAWSSTQSKVISSRHILEQKFSEMKHKFANGEIPLPTFWGGYKVQPSQLEFWQGRGKRLHDRFQYSRQSNHWIIDRLAP